MATEQITELSAREIVDCRLEPTLRVSVETDGGTCAVADVPRGRSTGKREAVDLRDSGDRYGGKGVERAVANVEERIAPALRGLPVTAQRQIDTALIDLDGTARKSELGGNAICGVSLAVLKAGAESQAQALYRYVGEEEGLTLPVPVFDLIEGGELAASGLDFQEHQVIPVGATSLTEAVRMSAEVYYELGEQLAEEWGAGARTVGFEGGYTPEGMAGPRDALDALLAAIEAVGYGDEFKLGLDVAASHFYDPATETYAFKDDQYSREQLIAYYEELTDTYPVVSIEDPLHEDDMAGFAELTGAVDCQIIGDDLFVTDPDRVREGIERGAATALLVKVNQVGTVSEALEAANVATEHGLALQVSERSGQTPDTWLAELAVGLNAGQIKTGVTRGERTEQYNRLMAIEDELGAGAAYADWPDQ